MNRQKSLLCLVVVVVGVTRQFAPAADIVSLRRAADHGDPRAQCYLGYYYEMGEGVKKDAREAVRWYRKAAEQGDACAQSNLGTCYREGQGVEKDAREAVRWYRKAAEQGNADAQIHLGWCYTNGHGVEKDTSEAVKWYRKAAEQGHADAQSYLGCCYRDGQGVEKDAREAVRWYRKAAEQGDAGAQSCLAWCYMDGQGVEKDASEAVRWYRKAAEQGEAYAHDWCEDHKGEIAVIDAVRWCRSTAARSVGDLGENKKFSTSVLIGALCSVVMILLMRYHMGRGVPGSRAVLYYKIWHYPSLLVGNCCRLDFWVLVIAMTLCLTAVVVCATIGFFLGAIAGLTGSLIAAAVGLFVAALLSEKIWRCLGNERYLADLGEDMLTPSARLRTVEQAYVFPFLCVVQSCILLGLGGSIIGDLLSKRHASELSIALVSAFFAFFCTQLIAQVKKNVTSRSRMIGLTVVQAAILGPLLVPARHLLANVPAAGALLDHLATLLGGQLTLDAVFVAVVGVLTAMWRGVLRPV